METQEKHKQFLPLDNTVIRLQLQFQSKYFRTLQCFSANLINHK